MSLVKFGFSDDFWLSKFQKMSKFTKNVLLDPQKFAPKNALNLSAIIGENFDIAINAL